MDIGNCDVCNQEPAVGVCSSSVGPMSMAYGRECLQRGAEPFWAFEYLYNDVGHQGEGLADWVSNLSTFKDGEYVTWAEYVERKRNGTYPPTETYPEEGCDDLPELQL